MLQVSQKEPGTADRDQEIAHVGSQKAQPHQKSIVAELRVQLFRPDGHRHQDHGRNEERVGDLEELGEPGVLHPLKPHGRMRPPNPVVERRHLGVAVNAADGWDEDSHFSVEDRNIREGIPVVEDGRRLWPQAALDRQHDQGDPGGVGGQEQRRSGHLAEVDPDEQGHGGQVADEQAVDGPEIADPSRRAGGAHHFSHFESLYHASVSSSPSLRLRAG